VILYIRDEWGKELASESMVEKEGEVEEVGHD
jgi:hypothetical protein